MAETEQKLYTRPAVRPPRIQDLEEISDELGLQCSSEEIEEYRNYVEKELGHFTILDKMVSPKLPVKYPRTPGYRPSPEENEYNAWYQKCNIVGAASGPMLGKRVAVKDTVCVAGVPMTNGTSTMEGFVPDEDASVITRVLDAGGCIVGKTVCEYVSGSSWANDINPTLNPLSPERTSGGSSSGCAVVVQTGEADMAIGGDQGGSVRIPACWCGIVGMKPTYGLVPYTGAVAIEITCDHLGPMAKTVYDCALLLEAIAGNDGIDSRQPRDLTVPQYTKLLTGDLSGQKVGLVTEGFDGCEADIQQVVKEAANKLTGAGAVVEEVSIPWHGQGPSIFVPLFLEGTYQCMVKGNGNGYHYKGHYTEGLLAKMYDGRKNKAGDLPETIKLMTFLCEYVTKNYGNKFYAKAQNMTRVLTKAYDAVLEKYDVIVMPTLPYTAPMLPKEGSTITELINNGFGMLKNTCTFDITGHPSLTINAGLVDGLPVGMEITGKHFEDAKVLNAAYALEKVMKK